MMNDECTKAPKQVREIGDPGSEGLFGTMLMAYLTIPCTKEEEDIADVSFEHAACYWSSRLSPRDMSDVYHAISEYATVTGKESFKMTPSSTGFEDPTGRKGDDDPASPLWPRIMFGACVGLGLVTGVRTLLRRRPVAATMIADREATLALPSGFSYELLEDNHDYVSE